MPATARRLEKQPAYVERIGGASPLRPADASDAPVTSSVHAQHAALQRVYGEPAENYPGSVKLAILFGASLILWGGILSGGMALAHALIR